MLFARARVVCWSVLVALCVALFPVAAHAQSAEAAPPPQPPPPPEATAPAQLSVHMSLPPGTKSANLFLNETFAAWLQEGVLPAPLALLPGRYAVRVSAAGLRSYESTIELAAGQLLDLQGALGPEPPSAPPLVPGPAPPVAVKKKRSFAQTYQAVVWGIGISCLGAAVIVGVATGIACAGGRCRSSSSSD